MKTYRYRKHILWMKYLLPAALLVFTIFSVSQLVGGDRSGVGTGFAVGLGLFQLAVAGFIWWFLGKFARVEVGLSENSIVYNGTKGRTEIPFEEITEIKQPSIRYAGGWIKIRSAEKTIRLTVVLEGISNFVRELKEALDNLQLSDRYDREKLFRFYKTATYSDHSWARIYEISFKFLLLLLAGATIGVVIALLQDRESLKDLFLILAPAAFVILIAFTYGIAEMIIGRQFAKATSEEEFRVPGRDLAFESKVFKRALWIGIIVATLIVALLIAA